MEVVLRELMGLLDSDAPVNLDEVSYLVADKAIRGAK